jgi:hypothetical protein
LTNSTNDQPFNISVVIPQLSFVGFLESAQSIGISGNTLGFADGTEVNLLIVDILGNSTSVRVTIIDGSFAVSGIDATQFAPGLLSLTATASTITVSAANVTFKNLIVNPGVAEIDAAFTISGSDCVLDGLRCYPVSTYSYESFVLTTATADHLVIKNCDLVQTVAPTANKPFISLVGADYARIENNKLMVTVSNHADSCLIGGATTESLYVIIANNLLTGYAAGTTWLSILKLYTGTTGLVAYNAMAGTVTATTTMNDSATCFSVENYCIKIVDASGVIDPVAG